MAVYHLIKQCKTNLACASCAHSVEGSACRPSLQGDVEIPHTLIEREANISDRVLFLSSVLSHGVVNAGRFRGYAAVCFHNPVFMPQNVGKMSLFTVNTEEHWAGEGPAVPEMRFR